MKDLLWLMVFAGVYLKKLLKWIPLVLGVSFIGFLLYFRVTHPPEPKPDYITVSIDGCEYLKSTSGSPNAPISHKGNCTNVIHQKK